MTEKGTCGDMEDDIMVEVLKNMTKGCQESKWVWLGGGGAEGRRGKWITASGKAKWN